MAQDAAAESDAKGSYRGGGGTRRWSWQRSPLGEAGAEFLGTFVLIMFGDGIVATCVAGLSQSGRGELAFNSGDWILITFAWGFAVMLGVYIAGGVSGAHLNPAVTFAQALRRGFPWSKVPTYVVAQVFGALSLDAGRRRLGRDRRPEHQGLACVPTGPTGRTCGSTRPIPRWSPAAPGWSCWRGACCPGGRAAPRPWSSALRSRGRPPMSPGWLCMSTICMMVSKVHTHVACPPVQTKRPNLISHLPGLPLTLIPPPNTAEPEESPMGENGLAISFYH